MCGQVTPPDATADIDLDLAETFTHHRDFARSGLRDTLRNVLMAYAWKNSAVGYCPGMNVVAGILLLVLRDEERTFFVLSCIVEQLFPGLYAPSRQGLHVDARVLSRLIAAYLPDTAEAYQRAGLMTDLLGSVR
jgi:hypothetical protein